jgi:hypothetical protein
MAKWFQLMTLNHMFLDLRVQFTDTFKFFYVKGAIQLVYEKPV